MFRLSKFYSPDTPPGAAPAGDGLPTDKDDVIKFLGDDDKAEKPEPITLDELDKDDDDEDKERPIKKTEKDEEEEPDELAEIEEEIEEPTEEQLELVAPVRRREILAKYPNLFKEFPYLEKAYYREQEFTNILGTIDDAKAAVEARDILASFEADVTKGNTELLLRAVKDNNPDGFNTLIDNYLPTLAKVDERAYHHVLGNVAKHTIIAMVREAKRSDNDTLKAAAQVLNQFIFGSSDFVPPTTLGKPQTETNDPEKKQLIERERQYHRQAFESTVDDLNGRVNNILKSTIEGNIDPKKSMTDYVRKQAARDAMESLESMFSKDARFRSLTDKLWEQAAKENFSKPSVDRIKSAFVSKAKTLLPSVIKKARNEALQGLGRSPEDETPSSPKKGPVSPGKPRSVSSGKIKSAKDIPKGMSTLEFLNS
jgi:hypothetical protein